MRPLRQAFVPRVFVSALKKAAGLKVTPAAAFFERQKVAMPSSQEDEVLCAQCVRAVNNHIIACAEGDRAFVSIRVKARNE